MKKLQQYIKKLHQNQDGNTMVSVVVGFLLLLMTVAMLQQVVTYTYRMMDRAQEVRAATDELLKEYYTDVTVNTQKADVLTGDGKIFYMVNKNDTSDGFYFSFDLNQRYSDDVSLFYLGNHQLITGGDSTQ